MLIHIGYHKSGTTFLQRYVFFCSPPTHFQAPWTVESGEPVQHFVLTHPTRFDAAKVRAEFFSKIDGNCGALVPVISQQALCGNPVCGRYYGYEVAKRVFDTFPEAKILITIREQKSALRSLYGQYVRQDGEWPIQIFLGTGDEPPGFAPIGRLDHLEYDLLVGRYARLFGESRVLVLPFELLAKNPINFLQYIYDFAETGATATTPFEPELVGLGAYSLKLMRGFNKVIRRPPDWYGKWNRLPLLVRAQFKLCERVDAILPQSWHKPDEGRLNRVIEKRTTGYYKASNSRLQELTKFDLASYGYDI